MRAQQDKEVDRLAKAYRAARTEFERRTVCLDAIDSGLIGDLRPVAVVDAIFGTTYAGKLPLGKEFEDGRCGFPPSTRRRPTLRGRRAEFAVLSAPGPPCSSCIRRLVFCVQVRLHRQTGELLLEQFAQIASFSNPTFFPGSYTKVYVPLASHGLRRKL